MAIGGIVALVFGVKAEKSDLEDLAAPLTSDEDTDSDEEAEKSESKRSESKESEGDEDREDPRAVERRQRDARIRERRARQVAGSTGSRRYRPGPGRGVGSPWLPPAPSEPSERALDSEIELITAAMQEHDEMAVADLAEAVNAKFWGPGRFPGRCGWPPTRAASCASPGPGASAGPDGRPLRAPPLSANGAHHRRRAARAEGSSDAETPLTPMAYDAWAPHRVSATFLAGARHCSTNGGHRRWSSSEGRRLERRRDPVTPWRTARGHLTGSRRRSSLALVTARPTAHRRWSSSEGRRLERRRDPVSSWRTARGHLTGSRRRSSLALVTARPTSAPLGRAARAEGSSDAETP